VFDWVGIWILPMLLDGSEEHLRSWIPLLSMLASTGPGIIFLKALLTLSIEAYLKLLVLVLAMPNKL
jgi:hypothetical protein